MTLDMDAVLSDFVRSTGAQWGLCCVKCVQCKVLGKLLWPPGSDAALKLIASETHLDDQAAMG